SPEKLVGEDVLNVPPGSVSPLVPPRFLKPIPPPRSLETSRIIPSGAVEEPPPVCVMWTSIVSGLMLTSIVSPSAIRKSPAGRSLHLQSVLLTHFSSCGGTCCPCCTI